MEQSQFKRRTPEEWIKKFREKHGDKLVYHPDTFGRSRDKIKITCPIHGDFFQNPTDHLSKKGCGKCSYKASASLKKNSLSKWLKFFEQAHGDKYDYSKSVFVEAHTPIEIICNEHGFFSQTPNKHKHGQGCPECAKYIRNNVFNWESRMEGREVRFYVIKCTDGIETFFKVGATSTPLKERFVGNKLPYQYTSLIEYCSKDIQVIKELEDTTLEKFSNQRYLPTKFFNGYRECLTDIDLDWVNNFIKNKKSVVC